MRAALSLLACELFGAEAMRALDYAACIEHIQNLTLIHDDISDGDPERRSRPSIWKKFGVGQAVNIGDAFVPLSCGAILESHYPLDLKISLVETVSHYGLLMATGQALDINLRTVPYPSLLQYFDCTRKKTGAFLAMAVVGGALIGGANQSQLAKLDRYATLAGIAFQIKDDLLDVSGHKGRAVGCDLREGKITAHVIYAMSRASQEERKRLLWVLRKSRATTRQADINWTIELFRKTQAVEAAQQVSEKMISAALQHLTDLPDCVAKSRLIRLSQYLSARAH